MPNKILVCLMSWAMAITAKSTISDALSGMLSNAATVVDQEHARLKFNPMPATCRALCCQPSWRRVSLWNVGFMILPSSGESLFQALRGRGIPRNV